jgi:hypothetical protein
MKKGISPVISAMLIMLIAISFTVLVMIWIPNFTSSFAPSVERDVSFDRSRACLNIEGVDDNIGAVVIRNCGKNQLSEFSFYVDGNLVRSDNITVLEPGQIANFGISVIVGKHYFYVTADNAESPSMQFDVLFWNYANFPVYSNNQTNNTLAGKPTLFSLDWADNIGLSGYVFSTNNSGIWANSSFVRFTGIQNTSWNVTTLNPAVGVTVGWRFYANDTANNWSASEIFSLITQTSSDSAPPKYSQSLINSTLAGNPTLFSLNWTDNVALSGYIFRFCNGTWNGTMCLGLCMSGPYSTGWINGTAVYTVAGSAWTNPTNVYSPNNAYARQNENRVNVLGLNLSTGVPNGATILGIGIATRANASSSYGTNQIYFEVSNDSGMTWSRTGTTTGDMDTTNTYRYYGSASNLWGLSWNSGSGVQNLRISANGSDSSTSYYTRLDWLAANVTYNIETVGDCGWVNRSFVPMTGMANWSNTTEIINETTGANIAWCVYANDTDGNWNATSCQTPFSFVTTDALQSNDPRYFSSSVNNTISGQPTKFSLGWSDNIGLDGYIFSICNGTHSTALQGTYDRSCENIRCVQKGSNFVCDCSIIATKDGASITMTARSNNPSFINASFRSPNVPAGASNIKTCVNITSRSSDTSVSDGLRVYFWRASTSSWNLAFTRTSWSSTTTDYDNSFCDSSIITTAADANDLNITVVLTGDSSFSDDTFRIDNLQANISYDYVSSSPCSDENAILTNSTWVSMSGVINWSNVTRTIASTVGSTIKWCVYANDSDNNWNGTSCVNPFTLTTTGTDTASIIVGGLKGKYYNDMNLVNYVLTRTDSAIDFDWGDGSPDSSVNADGFSVMWQGYVKADYSETYAFSINSDDGVRLWVDGNIVVDSWVDQWQGQYPNTGTIYLTSGWHTIVVEYFENAGGAAVNLHYSSPSTPNQIVPSDHLGYSDKVFVYDDQDPATFSDGWGWDDGGGAAGWDACCWDSNQKYDGDYSYRIEGGSEAWASPLPDSTGTSSFTFAYKKQDPYSYFSAYFLVNGYWHEVTDGGRYYQGWSIPHFDDTNWHLVTVYFNQATVGPNGESLVSSEGQLTNFEYGPGGSNVVWFDYTYFS